MRLGIFAVRRLTHGSRSFEYLVVPAFLTVACALTWVLLRIDVSTTLVSGIVVGALAACAAVLERLVPARHDYVELDQPLAVELLHFVFNYHLGYVLALGACAGMRAGVQALSDATLWPASWPLPLQLVLAVTLAEGASYWQHRLSHRVPWLWRFHALHHSGSRLNLARAGRFHFVDIGAGAFLVFLPLFLLGAPEPLVSWLAALSGTLGVIQHANMRVRTPAWLDRWICTPGVHRFHHSLDQRESDANFGTTFMVFDRLLGTYFAPQAPGPARVGVADDPVRPGFLAQVFGPFRSR